MKAILLTAAGNPVNQDRGLVIHEGLGIVVAVADGAGGRSGGEEAAKSAMEFIRQNLTVADTAESCSELLRRMDAAIATDLEAGETTCALAVVTPAEVFGASVGDSGVWLIPEEGPHNELTGGQQRKPFIGTGSAWPVPFRHQIGGGSLLLATDGLFKYASPERILDTCRRHPPELAVERLIELVRYASGGLPDDVTVILTRL